MWRTGYPTRITPGMFTRPHLSVLRVVTFGAPLVTGGAEGTSKSESGDQVGTKSGLSQDQVRTKSRSCDCAGKNDLWSS